MINGNELNSSSRDMKRAVNINYMANKFDQSSFDMTYGDGDGQESIFDESVYEENNIYDDSYYYSRSPEDVGIKT